MTIPLLSFFLTIWHFARGPLLATEQYEAEYEEEYEEEEGSTPSTPEPVILKVFPTYGPQAGGTNITITGENFPMSSFTTVEIGARTCTVFDEKRY